VYTYYIYNIIPDYTVESCTVLLITICKVILQVMEPVYAIQAREP
jgi:hypothetical protein